MNIMLQQQDFFFLDKLSNNDKMVFIYELDYHNRHLPFFFFL